ncbi:hypothetical protein F2Q68_00013910 [Brassica cretica]|uniref:Uncharacterized protein n=1 Tax=Brassica cretica TaxID=69181 RepID=A0A8S9HK23_BRACR|nr:hypothetical protein F2Q68_00013910 [Brassica cretica]
MSSKHRGDIDDTFQEHRRNLTSQKQDRVTISTCVTRSKTRLRGSGNLQSSLDSIGKKLDLHDTEENLKNHRRCQTPPPRHELDRGAQISIARSDENQETDLKSENHRSTP